MPQRRGVRRGRLFRSSLAPRDRLVYLRDFLDWVYAKRKSPGQLQQEALAWWIGIHPEQARQEKPREWTNILRATGRWRWVAVQSAIREKIERIFLPSADRKEAERVTAERQLGVFAAPDGERYFQYQTAELSVETPEDWVSAAIDRTLLDLQDLSVKVIERCHECGRLFCRLRPSVGRYCSPGCRHLAYLKMHGFRPLGETTARTHAKKRAERGKEKGDANRQVMTVRGKG